MNSGFLHWFRCHGYDGSQYRTWCAHVGLPPDQPPVLSLREFTFNATVFAVLASIILTSIIRFKYLRMASILYAPTIFSIKLSILLQYIQVFMPNKQPRFLYWITILLIGCNAVAYFVLDIIQIWSCNPIRKSWDPFVTGGWCLDVEALNVSASSVNVASDTVIFLLPQYVIWRLHMPTKQKVAVSLMFLVAILSVLTLSLAPSFPPSRPGFIPLLMMASIFLGQLYLQLFACTIPSSTRTTLTRPG